MDYLTEELVRRHNFLTPGSGRDVAPRAEVKVEKLLMYFGSRKIFEKALQSLINANFSSDEILINKSHNGTFLDEPKAMRLGQGLIVGVVSGVITGSILSGIFGVKIFNSPDPVIDFMFTILTGGVVGGMIGAPIGAIVGQVIPAFEAEDFSTSLTEGSIVVEVDAKTEERFWLAKSILENHGGWSIGKDLAGKSA